MRRESMLWGRRRTPINLCRTQARLGYVVVLCVSTLRRLILRVVDCLEDLTSLVKISDFESITLSQ